MTSTYFRIFTFKTVGIQHFVYQIVEVTWFFSLKLSRTKYIHKIIFKLARNSLTLSQTVIEGANLFFPLNQHQLFANEFNIYIESSHFTVLFASMGLAALNSLFMKK